MILNSPITDEEITERVKSLNCKKAAAGDLTPQHFKYAMPALLPYLRKLFNRLFTNKEFPKAWSKSILIPIYKKEALIHQIIIGVLLC